MSQISEVLKWLEHLNTDTTWFDILYLIQWHSDYLSVTKVSKCFLRPLALWCLTGMVSSIEGFYYPAKLQGIDIVFAAVVMDWICLNRKFCRIHPPLVTPLEFLLIIWLIWLLIRLSHTQCFCWWLIGLQIIVMNDELSCLFICLRV